MLLFVDTETNGLPKNWKAPVTDLGNWPRMIQIAWLLFSPKGELLGNGDHIIRPDGFVISAESANIHGISQEKALREGIELRHAMEEFEQQLRKSSQWVAHNVGFDEMILGAEFLRLQKQNPLPKMAKFCTMKHTAEVCKIPGKYGFKWPTLSELHKSVFGTGFEESHNARADIEATARCFWELKRRGDL